MPRDDRFDLDVLPQRVVFGVGRVDEVPGEVERLGFRRVLVVSTGSAKYTADDLCDVLGGIVAARITGVLQHVPEAEATEAIRLSTAERADGILTIGGGSATGLGKAVAVSTGLTQLCVPTTYAGSEATSTYGITGAQKRTGRDPRALPRVVVYDPALTTGMPPRLTAASGMNAMAHCVEALYAKGGDPITSSLAQEGIRRLTSALPQATQTPADLAARGEALLGAHLAGWAMEHAGTALHHTLCHVIGGTYRVDHAEVHAVLLPYVAAYNAPAAPHALARVADALGAPDAAHGLRNLGERLNTPTDLASIGVPRDGLDQVVEAALLAVGDRNPRRPDTPSLRRLLDDAYAGREPGSY